jgi:hypothetical protein
MKKIIVVLVLLNGFYTSFAQDENDFGEEKKGGFKKENLFTGGNLNLGFSNYATVIGLTPFFGYSINKYLDVAITTNYNYSSFRDYLQYGDKLRLSIYGPGTFVRIFPLKFLFTQVQYEYNFIDYNYIPTEDYPIYQPEKDHVNAHSLLVGGGYVGGRQGIGSSFYYFSVMWDVAGASQSPYVDGLGRAVPIFRAGYNIALFQGQKERY